MPWGFLPVSSIVLICASVQLPMPVSLSGVMLGAVTSNGGSLKRKPPEKSLPATAGGGPFGEWQLAQVMMVLTRYLPRSADGCATALPPNATATAAPSIRRIIESPSSLD